MTDQPRFFDSHAHLDANDFGGDLEATIERARSVGITDIVCIGASEGFESNPKAVAIAESHDRIYATVGIHPHDAKIADRACLEAVEKLSAHPKVVAIGETGLDYHYDHSPREMQRDAFRAFVRMAKTRTLPIVVHTREAEDDTIQILVEEDAKKVGGVIHCFTGTDKLADAALDLGFYISFSGVLTFKNAEALRAIAKRLPKEKVLVETDCPFLAPIPFRGKRNEPSYIVETTKLLADLWGSSLEDVKASTGSNAAALFRIG
jgi:TatD DNase family protein